MNQYTRNLTREQRHACLRLHPATGVAHYDTHKEKP